MSRLMIRIAVFAATVWVEACAGNPPPVPVFASRADSEILAGHWRGAYTSANEGRRGVIEFTLSAADEAASGDVLMIAEKSRVSYRPYPPGDPRLRGVDVPATQFLTIRFVRAEAGQINGTIASYWDPDRSCQASASFLGTLQGRVIDGTFTSFCEDGVRQLRGRWSVRRER